MRRFHPVLIALLAAALFAAGCGDSGADPDGAPPEPDPSADDPPEPDPSADEPPADDPEPPADDPPVDDPEPPADDPPADDPPVDEPETPTLDLSGDQAVVVWDQVSDTYVTPVVGAADPFFQIHSSNAADGFYLDFELYTVWGAGWTGQTGTFPVQCNDPVADTGICVHFDPDGPGPDPDLGADFGASGTVTIDQLDAGGYDIAVSGLTFTDGTTFADFVITG